MPMHQIFIFRLPMLLACYGVALMQNPWDFRAPSCPEISQLSWNQQLSWNFTHFVRMSWYGPLLCCRYTFLQVMTMFFVADVECQVMFSVVTLYCSMCNIALVTFLGLQNWSASMINIYEHRRTCIFCVLSLVKPTSVLKLPWNFLKIWSWNFVSCYWKPWDLVTSNLCSELCQNVNLGLTLLLAVIIILNRYSSAATTTTAAAAPIRTASIVCFGQVFWSLVLSSCLVTY